MNLSYEKFAEVLKSRDSASYYGFQALQKMRGPTVKPYADDILGWLEHRLGPKAFDLHLHRVKELRRLQTQFDQTGRYPASKYSEVKPIDDEEYKTSLLLSFIATNHRFEILQHLAAFLRHPLPGPRQALFVGYGTGYELKLAFDQMSNWSIHAYDSSPESFKYCSLLLGFFGYSANSLKNETFPLSDPVAAAAAHGKRFGKVVLCELLEHLEDPAAALVAVRETLADDGLLFCTMAVNIAQEDHVYLYCTADQARQQALASGFEIVSEFLAPVVILPFTEADRASVFKKGNYICVLRRKK